MIKIAILGAAGRMGQALIRCSAQVPGLKVVAALESDQCPQLGKDAGIVAGGADIGVPLHADTRKAVHAADVLIDFSFPSVTLKHVQLAGELKKSMVIGTTGLSDNDGERIRQAALAIPIVWSPNMSLGVNLLFAIVEQTAQRLADYDVEIVETHHQHKKDAPSGTALHLAEAVAAARGIALDKVVTHGRQGMVGERPPGQIGIHSIRAGDVVGDHTVIFATNGERLELTHRASSRDCLALGALHASEWVHGHAPGLFTMQHVLGIGA